MGLSADFLQLLGLFGFDFTGVSACDTTLLTTCDTMVSQPKGSQGAGFRGCDTCDTTFGS